MNDTDTTMTNRVLKVLFCFYLCLITNVAVHAQPKPFSDMDVFHLEWVADPQISPDGRQVVYQRKGMDEMTDHRTSQLWIINSDGSGNAKLTNRDVNESSPRWSPDGKRIAFISSDKENGSEIYMYWVNSGKTARITQLRRSPGHLSWSPDGKYIAFSMLLPKPNPVLVKPPKKPKGAKWAKPPRVTERLKYEADGVGYLEPGFEQLFVVVAHGGTARQVTSGNYHQGTKPVWTPDGQSLIFSANRHKDWAYDRHNSEIYTVSVEDSTSITPLTSRQGPDYNPVISPDGKKVAYLGYDDKIQTYQLTRLYIMNSDGSGKQEININLKRSISSIVWDKQGRGLYFKYDNEGDTKIGYTNVSGKVTKVASHVGGTTIGRPYGGGSFSVSDDGIIAMNQTAPSHPAELSITKKGQNEAKNITDLNGDLLDHRTMGKVEEVWYKSSVDGRQLQGWIVKPPFFDPDKQYPMILEIHGGPISNYGDRFTAEIQLYAAAGYVVFYANPRGSTGYGEEFGNLLYDHYPGNDYDDLMDGVDTVLKQGYVSKDRLYVTGGSAGGIMTAWIVGKTNRFRSAAVVKPVINWISKTLTADNYYGYANYRYPGQPWENVDEYWKYSPLSLVGHVQTPTMVMGGTADLRTPPSEAKQFYSALKLRKIKTALVQIPGASHHISTRPSQLITKVNHVLAWFKKYP